MGENNIVTTVQKCEKCGRLLKKNSTDSLCAKCLTEQETPDSQPPENTDMSGDITANIDSDNIVSEEKKDVAELKPSQAVLNRFNELIERGLISDDILKMLTDKEGSAKAGFRYPFLKEFSEGDSLKERAYIKGFSRYYAKPVVVNGKQFLICNDIYKATVPKFMEWADTL